jgi:glycosyltransferase involved in cell wall biosynthesis
VNQRLIVVGPLPPPFHGVTVSTSLVLANPYLRKRFSVEHLDTSDHRSGANVGSWDATNVAVAIKSLLSLLSRLQGQPGVIYLPLSQSLPGVIRDSLFVHAASRRRWKVALHLRGSDFREFYESSRPTIRQWIRATLARADSVAVMGNSLRWVFEGLVPLERIHVVANGTPDIATNGGERDGTQVLFLSNLRQRKGVAEAVEAALLALQSHSSAQFLFVGDWEDPVLERKVRGRAREANGRIAFRPAVSGYAKDQLLARSSIFLFPPVAREGHPRVVLEALAAGLPIVTTDRGAIEETVVDGECGFVLPDPQPDQLAERITLLLNDSDLRQRMGRAARQRYLARYTQEAADRRLADWLSSIAI